LTLPHLEVSHFGHFILSACSFPKITQSFLH